MEPVWLVASMEVKHHVRVDDVFDAFNALHPGVGKSLVGVEPVLGIHFKQTTYPILCVFGDVIPHWVLKRVVAAYNICLDLNIVLTLERWCS